MKKEILYLIIGILVGAILSTTVLLLVNSDDKQHDMKDFDKNMTKFDRNDTDFDPNNRPEKPNGEVENNNTNGQ